MSVIKPAVLAALALSLSSTAFAGAVRPGTDATEDMVPTGKGFGERPSPERQAADRELFFDPAQRDTRGNASPGTAAARKISYHGGPVMNAASGANVYYIWYGNWSGNSAPTILTDLARTVGGSPWFGISSTYYSGTTTRNYVKNVVNYVQSTTDAYSQGTALSDAQIKTVVSSAITSGRLPKDSNGVYFVLTSQDVNATSGFCTQYCGWHTNGTIAGADIKYSFVGNPDRCPNACAAQTTGPNGNAGADGMASILLHELTESVTDPDLNAWYDSSGAENADKCAWTFGTTYTAPNGAKANVAFGSRNFYVQRNWSAATQACGMQ